MKVALIFLATVVVITHQQFQHPRRMFWMPYSAQRVLSNYYQPHFYDDVVEDESPLYRQLSPSRPFAYPQVYNYEKLLLLSYCPFSTAHEMYFQIICIN